MSAESHPLYHYSGHLEAYDIDGPREADGEIGFVMDMLDEVLYTDGGGTVIQPHAAKASRELFESRFSHQYYRGETSFLGWAWPLESITLSIEHTRHLGRTVLLQSYKIKVDNSIHQTSIGNNRVTSLYYLEEFSGGGKKYSGSIIRPNIIGDPDQTDEPMTVYDCDQLFTVLDQVVGVIRQDKRDRAIVP